MASDRISMTAKAEKDTTARQRVLTHLARVGSIEDADGAATAKLRDAISYTSGPQAFIQLVAAMDRTGEIKREIRGKRTYAISLGAAAESRQSNQASTSAPQVPAGQTVDYDELASRLLGIVFEVARGASQAEGPTPGTEGFPLALEVKAALLEEELRQINRQTDIAVAENENLASRLRIYEKQLRGLSGAAGTGENVPARGPLSRQSDDDLLKWLISGKTA
jgi:hypothetical protein